MNSFKFWTPMFVRTLFGGKFPEQLLCDHFRRVVAWNQSTRSNVSTLRFECGSRILGKKSSIYWIVNRTKFPLIQYPPVYFCLQPCKNMWLWNQKRWKMTAIAPAPQCGTFPCIQLRKTVRSVLIVYSIGIQFCAQTVDIMRVDWNTHHPWRRLPHWNSYLEKTFDRRHARVVSSNFGVWNNAMLLYSASYFLVHSIRA